MIKYIHYGSNDFDINKFDPIKNGEAAYLRVMEKPEGGLWASPINSKDNWHDWCLNNDFKVNQLEKSFTFTLKPGSKVLTIRTMQDIIDIFEMLTVVPLGRRIGNHINFEELLKLGYDAIMVYISNVDVYYRLYGWDVDSLLVMNPDCIEVL